jgi:hypothetical protein
MAQVVECLHAYQAEGPKFTSTARKKKKKIRVGGVAQVIECLPSKREALNSNSSTAKINK